jgi:hypothetical protein
MESGRRHQLAQVSAESPCISLTLTVWIPASIQVQIHRKDNRSRAKMEQHEAFRLCVADVK